MTGELRRMAFAVTPWTAAVPVVALFAGLLIAVSARTANGTDLRSGNSSLTQLIQSAEHSNRQAQSSTQQLQKQVAALTARQAGSDEVIKSITSGYQHLLEPAGLTALTGPGLSVTLKDAPADAGGNLDSEQANATLVHQSDLQAVVNALWQGGADAIEVMGQRLVSTSAIICVGNTLLLNGRVYSPPFAVRAIGPAAEMRQRLDASPSLVQYRKDAATYGLGYDVSDVDSVSMPAYQAPLSLRYAVAGS